jgi:tRNA(fMet)-specific endonuclease VapC
VRVGYLVDTDWIIDHFNRVEGTTQKLKELRPAGIAMSVISLAELYEGVIYSRDPSRSQQALDTFLQEIPVLGVDEEICKAFGRERGRLRQQRKTVSDFDLLIASTCLCNGLILLTNNRRHYEMIEGLQVLSLP